MKTRVVSKVVSLLTAISFLYCQVVGAAPYAKAPSQDTSARKSSLMPQAVSERFSKDKATAILQEQEELNNIFDSVYSTINADIDTKTPDEINAKLTAEVTAQMEAFKKAKTDRKEKMRFDLVSEGIRAVVVEQDGKKTIAYLSIPFKNIATNNMYTYIVRDKSVLLSEEDKDFLKELPFVSDKSMPERNLSVEVRKIPTTNSFKQLVALKMAIVEKDPSIPSEVKKNRISFLKSLPLVSLLVFMALFMNGCLTQGGEVLPTTTIVETTTDVPTTIPVSGLSTPLQSADKSVGVTFSAVLPGQRSNPSYMTISINGEAKLSVTATSEQNLAYLSPDGKRLVVLTQTTNPLIKNRIGQIVPASLLYVFDLAAGQVNPVLVDDASKFKVVDGNIHVDALGIDRVFDLQTGQEIGAAVAPPVAPKPILPIPGLPGKLAIAGRPEVLPEVAKGTPIVVDAELQSKIDAVELEIETLLTQPGNIDSFVNMDRLLTAKPALGKTRDEVRANLTKELKQLIDGKTVKMVYYDSFTVGNKLIAHADPASKTVEFGADMFKKADPALVARVKLHELLHQLLGDPNHELIGEEEGLRDRLLSDIVTVSAAATAVEAAVAGVAAGVNKVLADNKLPALNNIIGAVEALPGNKAKPAVIYLTVEPENNIIGLEEAVKKLHKENRQVKIILIGKEEYKWTGDLRMKLKDSYGNIIVDFVPKAVFDAKVASVKDVDKAAVELAGEITKMKVGELDIGWISSVEDAYQVASGFVKIPVIKAREKAADQLYNIGTQIDVMELVIMAHRISGKDLSAVTFAQLAESLGDKGAQFLAALDALGIKADENVAQELMKIPPTTSVSGKVATDLNSIRSALRSA